MNESYNQGEAPAKVTVTDIDIPFGRLVVLILKFMLASIPAVLIMYAVLGVIALLMFGVLGGAAGVFNKLSSPQQKIDFLPDGGKR